MRAKHLSLYSRVSAAESTTFYRYEQIFSMRLTIFAQSGCSEELYSAGTFLVTNVILHLPPLSRVSAPRFVYFLALANASVESIYIEAINWPRQDLLRAGGL